MQQPVYGTRQDCIARSHELRVNTTTNYEHSLAEAVTCDMYSIDKARSSECVCFPAYEDLTTTNDLRDGRIVSSFFPPSQVVESYLLAAITGGPPLPCHGARCVHSASLLTRPHLSLGAFPYCASTALRPDYNIAPRTAASDASIGPSPSPTSTQSLSSPSCRHNLPSLLKSECMIQSCLYQYRAPYNTTYGVWSTFTNAVGNPIYADWTYVTSSVSTSHWGVDIPTLGTKSPSTRPQWPEVTAAAISRAKQYGYYHSVKFPPQEKEPLCANETDCRRHCAEQQEKQEKFTHSLLIGAGIVTGIAFTGMALACLSGYRQRKRYAREYEERVGEEIVQPEKAACGPEPELRILAAEPEPESTDQQERRDLSVPEPATDGGVSGVREPVSVTVGDVQPVPAQEVKVEKKRKSGTLRRAAEEGRIVPKVRFSDGEEVVGRASGRDNGSVDGGSVEGVRSRVVSGAE